MPSVPGPDRAGPARGQPSRLPGTIPQRIGHTYNAASSVVAITHDAGRTWQRVTFAVPAKVPGGMQGDSFIDIGQIQCPQPDACIAIGVSDQGSTSTPIYTNHG